MPVNQESTLLSIVVPLFNEESNVEALYDRLLALEQALHPITVEIVFVDDHSSDQTFEIVSALAGRHPRLKLLRLSRNYGSHAAIMAGLKESSGDCAVFLAGDLQDPPELIQEMLERWRAGNHIVWAARLETVGQKRRDRFFSSGYWRLVRWLTEIELPAGGVDFFLIDRLVLGAVVAQANRHSPIFLIVAETGFKSSVVYYTKASRAGGKSGWTLKKKLMLTFETMLFSLKPLRILSAAGIVLSFLGLAGALLCTALLPLGLDMGGWPALFAVICFFGGLQMTMIGMVGEYLNLNLKETRKVPRFIVQERLVSPGPAPFTPGPAPVTQSDVIVPPPSQSTPV